MKFQIVEGVAITPYVHFVCRKLYSAPPYACMQELAGVNYVFAHVNVLVDTELCLVNLVAHKTTYVVHWLRSSNNSNYSTRDPLLST